MDVQLFHTFTAVATHGSVSKAAVALGYSQPAVTHQVQRLEHLLRARLFDRCAGGVRLTSTGERLLPLARIVVTVLGEMRAHLEPTTPTTPTTGTAIDVANTRLGAGRSVGQPHRDAPASPSSTTKEVAP